VTTDPDLMKDCGAGVSNFDRCADAAEVERLLRAAEPGTLFAYHTARDHCGRVWFDGERFWEVVKVHRAVVANLVAESVADLCGLVNDLCGHG
jgi:hypothetical protein